MELLELAAVPEYAHMVAEAVAPLLVHGAGPDSPSSPLSPRQATRLSAAMVLGRCGTAASAHLPTLISMLSADHEEDWHVLSSSLCGLCVRESEHVDLLLPLLEASTPRHRRVGAYLLLTPRPQHTSGSDALQWKLHVARVALMLGDPASEVRSDVASLLGEVGGASAPHMSRLIDCFHDENSSVRRHAAAAVGKLRQVATSQNVERVIEGLADPDDAAVGGGAMSVRRAALLAFTGLFGGDDRGNFSTEDTSSMPPAVAATTADSVSALLSHTSPDAREMAARAMVVMGGLADVTGLIRTLQDEVTLSPRGDSARSSTLPALPPYSLIPLRPIPATVAATATSAAAVFTPWSFDRRR